MLPSETVMKLISGSGSVTYHIEDDALVEPIDMQSDASW